MFIVGGRKFYRANEEVLYQAYSCDFSQSQSREHIVIIGKLKDERSFNHIEVVLPQHQLIA